MQTEVFELEKDGEVYEVEAPSMEAAVAAFSGFNPDAQKGVGTPHPNQPRTRNTPFTTEEFRPNVATGPVDYLGRMITGAVSEAGDILKGIVKGPNLEGMPLGPNLTAEGLKESGSRLIAGPKAILEAVNTDDPEQAGRQTLNAATYLLGGGRAIRNPAEAIRNVPADLKAAGRVTKKVATHPVTTTLASGATAAAFGGSPTAILSAMSTGGALGTGIKVGEKLLEAIKSAKTETPTPPPAPAIPTPKPKPIDPVAAKMARGNANAQASERIVQGMSSAGRVAEPKPTNSVAEGMARSTDKAKQTIAEGMSKKPEPPNPNAGGTLKPKTVNTAVAEALDEARKPDPPRLAGTDPKPGGASMRSHEGAVGSSTKRTGEAPKKVVSKAKPADPPRPEPPKPAASHSASSPAKIDWRTTDAVPADAMARDIANGGSIHEAGESSLGLLERLAQEIKDTSPEGLARAQATATAARQRMHIRERLAGKSSAPAPVSGSISDQLRATLLEQELKRRAGKK